MNPAYNAAIACYRGAARMAALGSKKVRHMLHGQRETFDRLSNFRSKMAPEGFDVWFHAASLGEFEQARPLIEALLEHRPGTKILLSFFSPSGYEVRCNYDPRVAVVYMPFDRPALVKRFLDLAAPHMAIFVKYEFWGNYLEELRRRAVPTYIISAIFRPEQRFFRSWGCMFRRMLTAFTHMYVQDERSRKLLEGIGVTDVTVAGDTRFDRVTTIRLKGRDIPEIECFKSAAPARATIVFGSSWEEDEKRYMPWLAAHKDIRAVIAPHEFDKDRLAAMRRRLGSDCTMLLSDFRRIYEKSPQGAAKVAAHLRFIIVDCFGLLSSLYRYADFAYIGGGFGKSIHNINEAAVYGIPVVFGPTHGKFKEAGDLIACGGGFSADSPEAIARIFDRLTDGSDERAKAGHAADSYISSQVGASAIIMKDIFNITI